MELDELEQRLIPFSRSKYEDQKARVSGVHKMPGHAGFAYGFTVESGELSESWFLRLPPPNVRWVGTADVLRQVAVLNALEGTDVPHCTVQWSGDDLVWFDRPYFVVPRLEGDVVRLKSRDEQGEPGWTTLVDSETRRSMARQAMKALAEMHRVDWHRASYLGDPIELAEDVERWDRFVPKAAEPQRLEAAPRVRELLLERLPRQAPIGIFHGDFQWANLFYSAEGKLLAVIDWELVGVGATLNDVGWIATFNDPAAWAPDRQPGGGMPSADELVALYVEAQGEQLADLDWYRALAAYKFSIISGFNLSLHRRGKRHDPVWEVTANSMAPLLERALELLGD